MPSGHACLHRIQNDVACSGPRVNIWTDLSGAGIMTNYIRLISHSLGEDCRTVEKQSSKPSSCNLSYVSLCLNHSQLCSCSKFIIPYSRTPSFETLQCISTLFCQKLFTHWNMSSSYLLHEVHIRIEKHDVKMLNGVYGLQTSPIFEPCHSCAVHARTECIVHIRLNLFPSSIGQVACHLVLVQLKLGPYY